MEKKHLVIPDLQVKPNHSLKHLEWINKLAKAVRPTAIIQLGDLWDMASLSAYDAGKKSAEGKRLTADWNAGIKAIDILMQGVPSSVKWYFTEGNHEERIKRHENAHPELEGSLPNPVAYLHSRGWNARPYMEPLKVDGITYAHLFPRGVNGTISQYGSRYGAANARTQVKANMTTCIAGHKQGLDSAIQSHANGMHRAVIAGSCYTHNEGYLTPQGVHYWRGVLVLHDVRNGQFDLEEWSLERLRRKFNAG